MNGAQRVRCNPPAAQNQTFSRAGMPNRTITIQQQNIAAPANRTFDLPPSRANQTFNLPPSRANQTFNLPPPRANQTFNVPRGDATFQARALGQTFARPPPPVGPTFARAPANQTYARPVGQTFRRPDRTWQSGSDDLADFNYDNSWFRNRSKTAPVIMDSTYSLPGGGVCALDGNDISESLGEVPQPVFVTSVNRSQMAASNLLTLDNGSQIVIPDNFRRRFEFSNDPDVMSIMIKKKCCPEPIPPPPSPRAQPPVNNQPPARQHRSLSPQASDATGRYREFQTYHSEPGLVCNRAGAPQQSALAGEPSTRQHRSLSPQANDTTGQYREFQMYHSEPGFVSNRAEPPRQCADQGQCTHCGKKKAKTRCCC